MIEEYLALSKKKKLKIFNQQTNYANGNGILYKFIVEKTTTFNDGNMSISYSMKNRIELRFIEMHINKYANK